MGHATASYRVKCVSPFWKRPRYIRTNDPRALAYDTKAVAGRYSAEQAKALALQTRGGPNKWVTELEAA